jgi:catechol 2,3-dioxygenase-like lactoylglutathione lyase family enzyme
MRPTAPSRWKQTQRRRCSSLPTTTTGGIHTSPAGYSHVAFAADDLEGTDAKLRDKGVEVELEPKTKTIEGHDYRISFVVDPDGYRVEFVERGTMKVGGIVQ